jgi:predicted secreted hydrolase
MKPVLAILMIVVLLRGASSAAAEPAALENRAAAWRRAERGWKYSWPRDHRIHPEFRTEWWYFTGNLQATDSRRFGYQLTFFRQGARPPQAPPVQSRFLVSDFKFGHFTLTDVASQRFHFSQQLSRGAFGEAGFGGSQSGQPIAWLLRTDHSTFRRTRARKGSTWSSVQ